MRWPVLLSLLLLACSICSPGAAAPDAPTGPGLTIRATPSDAHVGDTIYLNGTVTGINTIAVYLYVTGEDLDPRGVSLENLNIAAGRGLFTTAPVFMRNGTWVYVWDTSVILGNLKPGTYSVHVVGSPNDRLRSIPQETAVAEIRFAPAQDMEVETPVSGIVPVAALLLVMAAYCCRRRKE